MKEAFRLLNKSIIRVETPDVNLDQEEEIQMETDEGPGGINGEELTHGLPIGRLCSSRASWNQHTC